MLPKSHKDKDCKKKLLKLAWLPKLHDQQAIHVTPGGKIQASVNTLGLRFELSQKQENFVCKLKLLGLIISNV